MLLRRLAQEPDALALGRGDVKRVPLLRAPADALSVLAERASGVRRVEDFLRDVADQSRSPLISSREWGWSR